MFDIGPVTTRAHEYHNNLKFLLSQFQQKFNGGDDIVKSIKEKQHVDFDKNQPAIALSKNKDEKIRAIEQALLDEWNRTLQKGHGTRIVNYQSNTSRVYALLWAQCTQPLQQRIEALETFESKIEHDHVELIKAIEEQCLTSNQEHNYEMKLVMEALNNITYLKMLKEESVVDFYRRVLTAKEIYEKTTGLPLVLKNQTQSKGKSTENADEAFDRYLAYVMIQKSYKPKFGSLIQQLENAQQFKEMKYPKTLIEAKELLASHTYDLGWNKQPDSMKSVNQGQSENQKRNKKETKESDGTFEIPSLSFAQMENRCYACGQPGHTSTKCVHKSKIPKNSGRST